MQHKLRMTMFMTVFFFSQEEYPQIDVELQNMLNTSIQETTVMFDPEQNTNSLMVHQTNRIERRSPSPRVVVNSLDSCQTRPCSFASPLRGARGESSPRRPTTRSPPGEDDRGRPKTPPPHYDDIMYEI